MMAVSGSVPPGGLGQALSRAAVLGYNERMSEIFDVVNEDDEVIGKARRDEVHGNPALLHRVAHVLILDAAGRLFLQKRAPNKDVQPGKWDTSVGGHVDAGESPGAAALRELREEAGIVPEEGGAGLRFLYRYIHSNEYESEFVSTYSLVWDGPIHIQESEISEGRFWTFGEIEAAASSGIFTPNFLDEFRRFRSRSYG